MSTDWNLSPETRRAELVRRLRSGEYEQGNASLQRDGKFCCLGVACDMAVEAGVAVANMSFQDSVRYEDRNNPNDYSASALPVRVRSWIGFTSGFGITHIEGPATVIEDEAYSYEAYSYEAYFYTLAELNDDGLTFDQIADIIEAGLVDVDDQ